MAPSPHKDDRRVNEAIEAAEVRLVGADGEVLGVVNIDEALRKADEAGLDLVEMAANSSPPVCKILDYGKLKFLDQKRKADARKKQKTIDVKEIKMKNKKKKLLTELFFITFTILLLFSTGVRTKLSASGNYKEMVYIKSNVNPDLSVSHH